MLTIIKSLFFKLNYKTNNKQGCSKKLDIHLNFGTGKPCAWQNSEYCLPKKVSASTRRSFTGIVGAFVPTGSRFYCYRTY